jgi:hypothetical protein
VFDRCGSYDPILTVAIGLFVAGGALLLLLGRYPQSFPEADSAAAPAVMEPA